MGFYACWIGFYFKSLWEEVDAWVEISWMVLYCWPDVLYEVLSKDLHLEAIQMYAIYGDVRVNVDAVIVYDVPHSLIGQKFEICIDTVDVSSMLHSVWHFF